MRFRAKHPYADRVAFPVTLLVGNKIMSKHTCFVITALCTIYISGCASPLTPYSKNKVSERYVTAHSTTDTSINYTDYTIYSNDIINAPSSAYHGTIFFSSHSKQMNKLICKNFVLSFGASDANNTDIPMGLLSSRERPQQPEPWSDQWLAGRTEAFCENAVQHYDHKRSRQFLAKNGGGQTECAMLVLWDPSGNNVLRKSLHSCWTKGRLQRYFSGWKRSVHTYVESRAPKPQSFWDIFPPLWR
jgi:hypothetical protein